MPHTAFSHSVAVKKSTDPGSPLPNAGGESGRARSIDRKRRAEESCQMSTTNRSCEKFHLPYGRDLVGTRSSASALVFRLPNDSQV